MMKDFEVNYTQVSGGEVRPYLECLADLRITVFREFPYLYQGSKDYELKYLDVYTKSANSLVVLAQVEGQLVGASTCLPMSAEAKEFQQPFLDKNIDVSQVFYFGESIILPEFRGHKIGHHFFKLREDHALRSLKSLKMTTFCAVDREPSHPLRPKGYRPLDVFWNRMGYQKQEDMKVSYSWKDVDQESETQKLLTCWIKIWGAENETV